MEIKQRQNNFKINLNVNSINKDNLQKKKVNNGAINKAKSENNMNGNNKKDNIKTIFQLRREKLNEIKRKMEEITQDIMKSEDPLYQTQKNFIHENMDINKEINGGEENNNLSKFNEMQKRENNFMAKDNGTPNTFSRTFSGTKSFISNERIINNLSRYYTNINGNGNGINQTNNLKQFNLNLNNNIHNENDNNSINKNEKIVSNQYNKDFINENINIGNLINDVTVKNDIKSHPFNFNKEYIEVNDKRKLVQSLMGNKSDSCNKNKTNNLFRNNNLNNYELNTFNRNHNKININNYNLSNFNSFNNNTKSGIMSIMNENKNTNNNINKLVINKINKSPSNICPRNINNLN